ncbi:uncharacterized protein TNCV_2085561 [Trichonephila clavipes]|nr:uncharacterized protein TNCV_2085561 [Trichonephila clavipes]
MKTRLQKTGESLREYASEIERLANLTFCDYPASVREIITLQYFMDGLKNGETQRAVRMVDLQDLKSVLLSALKMEVITQASHRDYHFIQGTKRIVDIPCEFPWRKEIKKLKEEVQDLMAQHQSRRRRSITCWGCGEPGHLRSNCPRNNEKDRRTKCWGSGGARHLRNNCPRVHQEDLHCTSVIDSKEGSDQLNADALSRRPYHESCKYCSRVEKKFGVIDPVVCQVTTSSTLESDPWNDENLRKDQLADPEVKPIIEFKESFDEKPTW